MLRLTEDTLGWRLTRRMGEISDISATWLRWIEIIREFLQSSPDPLRGCAKPSCFKTSIYRSENKPFGLFRQQTFAVMSLSRNKTALLERWHLMKSLWRGKKSFAILSLFVSAPIQNSGFLNTDFYINYSLLHVIFLVAGISFHYWTKHVPSFLCPCQTTVSLMTHAEKSSDPLRGVNKPQGTFLLLDVPYGILDRVRLCSFAVDWVVDFVTVIWDVQGVDIFKFFVKKPF